MVQLHLSWRVLGSIDSRVHLLPANRSQIRRSSSPREHRPAHVCCQCAKPSSSSVGLLFLGASGGVQRGEYLGQAEGAQSPQEDTQNPIGGRDPPALCLFGPEHFRRMQRCRDALLFLDTGLRSSELLHLTEQDLHFADQWLKVMGKGQKERIASFGTQASKLLQRYFYYFRPEPLFGDQFFLCVDGWPMTENTIKLIFARQAKRVVFMMVSTLTNFPKLAPKASQVPVSIASRTAFTPAGLIRKSAAPPILSAKLIY